MMQTQSACPQCGGEGRIVKDKCHECHGDGIVKSDEIITINIPAGVQDGMQLAIQGQGNAAPRGGIAGDLIVLVEELEHDTFERQDANLYYNAFITYSALIKEAAALKDKNLTKDEKEVLEKLKTHPNFQPNPTKQERGFFDKMKEMFS